MSMKSPVENMDGIGAWAPQPILRLLPRRPPRLKGGMMKDDMKDKKGTSKMSGDKMKKDEK